LADWDESEEVSIDDMNDNSKYKQNLNQIVNLKELVTSSKKYNKLIKNNGLTKSYFKKLGSFNLISSFDIE
jgi:hypothetical protein